MINNNMLKFCHSPWTTVAITNDTSSQHSPGDVQICLCRDWQSFIPIGNIFEKSLLEIFNDEPVTKFRDTVVDQTFRYCKKDVCGRYWDMKEVNDLPYFINKVKRSLPTSLALGLDSTCNLACASCRNQSIFSPEINQTAWDILMKLSEEYKDFPYPTEISIDGTGDLFASATWRKYLNSDYIPKCFRFRITTNGNLITKNLDFLEKIKNQISEVTVSLDAGTSDTYKIVRGGNFRLVLEGIRALKDLDIRVGTQFVLQQKNYKEIVIYRDLVSSLNVDWIGLSQIVHWGHMPTEYWVKNKLEDNPDIDYDLLKTLLRDFDKTINATMSGGLRELIKD